LSSNITILPPANPTTLGEDELLWETTGAMMDCILRKPKIAGEILSTLHLPIVPRMIGIAQTCGRRGSWGSGLEFWGFPVKSQGRAIAGGEQPITSRVSRPNIPEGYALHARLWKSSTLRGILQVDRISFRLYSVVKSPKRACSFRKLIHRTGPIYKMYISLASLVEIPQLHIPYMKSIS
jgi:hypothetical protein